jgi:hypothetical protein
MNAINLTPQALIQTVDQILGLDDPSPTALGPLLRITLDENLSKPQLPMLTPKGTRFFEGSANAGLFARADLERRPNSAALDLTPLDKPPLFKDQIPREQYGKASIAVSPRMTPEPILTFSYELANRVTLSFLFGSSSGRLAKVVIRWAELPTSR